MSTPDSGDDSESTRRPSFPRARGVDDEEYATIDLVTRRRLISIGAGAALSTLLAGCGQQDDADATVDTNNPDGPIDGTRANPGETNISKDSEGNIVMRTLVDWNWPANETQFTPLAPSNWPGDYSGAFFHAPCTVWSYSKNQYIPYLLEELPTYRKCYQQHTFRKDFVWWDGMEHNALDNVYGHRISAYMCCGGPDEVVWAAQKGNSKWVWEENKGAPYRPQHAAANANKGIQFRRDIFKPLLEKFEDASTQKEIDAVTQEVNNLSLTLDNLEEHWCGTGLWKPVDWSADQIVMEQFEKHPDYQKTDIDRWVIQLAPKKQTRLQLINNNRVDAGEMNYRHLLQNPPGNLKTLKEGAGETGMGIKFNWRRTHGGNLHFRRAIASLLPIKRITQAAVQSGATAQVIDFQANAGPRMIAEKYTKDGFLDKLIDYGVEARPDEAAAYLRKGGYSKQGSSWVGPDGKKVSLRMIGQNQNLNSNVGNAISGLLNSFGLECNFSILESGSYAEEFGSRDNPPKGNFDIVLEPPSVGRTARDLMGAIDELDESVGWTRPVPEECVGKAVKAPIVIKEPMPKQPDGNGWETWHYGIPVNDEGAFPAVPTTVGQKDPSGATKRYKLFHHNWWAQYRFPDDTIQKWLTQTLWWNNFHMHSIAIYITNKELWMNTAKFKMREGGLVYDIRPDYYPHRFGDVVSK